MTGRHRLLTQHLVHDGRRVAGERLLARQKLVQNNAAGKQITARIDALAQKLLGRHVRGCAQHGASQRQLRGLGAGNAKVGNFYPAIGQHDQVGGLDVAVDHALAVRVRQRIQDLAHDAGRLGDGKAFIGLKMFFKLLAFDELHRDVSHQLTRCTVTARRDDAGLVVRRDRLAVVIHRYNAGVIQPPGGLSLTPKPRHDVGRFALDELRGQNGFDRNPAQQHRVKPLIHNAHGALAQLSANLVFTQLSDCQRHGGCERAAGEVVGGMMDEPLIFSCTPALSSTVPLKVPPGT